MLRKALQFGSNENIQITDMALGRIYLDVEITADAVNTALTAGVKSGLLGQTTFTVSKTQAGKSTEYTLPLDALIPVAFDGHPNLLQFVTGLGMRVITASASKAEVRRLMIPLCLGNHILKGNDSLDIKVNLPAKTNFFDASCDVASTVTLVAEPMVISQEFVEDFEFVPLTSQRSVDTITCKNPILGVYLINTAGSTDSDLSPWVNVQFKSDILNVDKTKSMLELQAFNRVGTIQQTGFNHVLVNFAKAGTVAQRASVNYTVNTANVGTNNTYVLLHHLVPNPAVTSRQSARNRSQAVQNAGKLGIN